MWIYDQSTPESALIPAVLLEASGQLEVPDTQESKPEPEIHSDEPRSVLTTQNWRFSSADCWTLAAAFLLGSAAAGVLRALCDGPNNEWLRYYVQQRLQVFSVSDMHPAAALFAVEYLTLLGAATVLMLFGFSAFGPVLIFLFTMLYGVGNGLLFSQLFAGTSWNARLLVFILTLVPSAAASACLCLLGAAALRVSGRIRTYSFLSGISVPCRPSAGALMKQYLFTIVLLLPLCGAAAGFARIESRLL